MTRLHALFLAAVIAAGCAGSRPFTPETQAPSNPFLIEGRDAEFAETCAVVYQAELGRPIDDVEAAKCLDRCRRGETKEQLVAWLRAGDEYKERQARLEQEAREAEERRRREEEEREKRKTTLSRLRVDGVHFVDANGATFRPVFVSGLTLLVRSAEERAAFLDWAAATGFNGVRVFAGRLTWAGQTAEGARAALPTLLEEAAARGLRVEVTAITDSRDGGYDEREHVVAIAAITAKYDNVILEVANEVYHHTQSDRVNDVAWLRAMAQHALAGYPHPWALGAAAHDEAVNGQYDTAGGTFATTHLDRGRDPLNQVRRVRETYSIVEALKVPAINNEPIGAAEVTKPGSRLADPYFFFALGALNRGFEVGGVFHSEDGLYARVPGPVQQACARAFVAGSRVAPTEERLSYRNARWHNSPVADAEFADPNHGPIVRAYSFVAPDESWGITVALTVPVDGPIGAIKWAAGWRVAGELARWPHVVVLRVER